MTKNVKKFAVLTVLTASLCLTIAASHAESANQTQEGHGPVTLLRN
jgi:hypothetical protein